MVQTNRVLRDIGVLVLLGVLATVALTAGASAQEAPDADSHSDIECEPVPNYGGEEMCEGYLVQTVRQDVPVSNTPGGETEYTIRQYTPGQIVDFARVEADGPSTVYAKVRYQETVNRINSAWTEVDNLKAGTCGWICRGDVVETDSYVNVRESPILPGDDSNVIKTAEPGERGAVLGGPVQMDGYRWWKIGYEDGTVGWTAEGYPSWLQETGINVDEFDAPLPEDQITEDLAEEGQPLIGCYAKLCPNDEVTTTAYLNVRTAPSLGAERVETVDPGTTGEVLEQPVYADGYQWNKVRYEDGTVGYSAAKFFAEHNCINYCIGESTTVYEGQPEGGPLEQPKYLFNEPATIESPPRPADDPTIKTSIENVSSVTITGEPRAEATGMWWPVETPDGTTGWVPQYALG